MRTGRAGPRRPRGPAELPTPARAPRPPIVRSAGDEPRDRAPVGPCIRRSSTPALSRVSFSDTDAQGVVYYGRYLPSFDMRDWKYHRHLRLHGYWQGEREFVMRSLEVTYDHRLASGRPAGTSTCGPPDREQSVTVEGAAYRVDDERLMCTARRTLVVHRGEGGNAPGLGSRSPRSSGARSRRSRATASRSPRADGEGWCLPASRRSAGAGGTAYPATNSLKPRSPHESRRSEGNPGPASAAWRWCRTPSASSRPRASTSSLSTAPAPRPPSGRAYEDAGATIVTCRPSCMPGRRVVKVQSRPMQRFASSARARRWWGC